MTIQAFPRRGLPLRSYASASGNSNILVLVEHKDDKISSATLNALTAASKLSPSSTITALVAGSQPDAVAANASKLAGVSKVLVAKHAAYDHGLPEFFAPLLVAATQAGGFTHIVAAHTAFGKNVLPRTAALLDVSQVSDVVEVDGADTFVRPIYAGESHYRVIYYGEIGAPAMSRMMCILLMRQKSVCPLAG